jgi:predicted enzyme related to lactoylglutathione lyase
MSATIRSLVVPVSDLGAAKAVYTALLGAPHTDESYYVGYNVNGFEVGLNPGNDTDGPVAFADVDDLDSTRQTLLAAGATERSAPRQVAPEARVCVLADADGNVLHPDKSQFTPGAVHVHDLQATILHLLGIDHEQLSVLYQGRRFRLTDVDGNVVKDILS